VLEKIISFDELIAGGRGASMKMIARIRRS
jgi:hypothetical protein